MRIAIVSSAAIALSLLAVSTPASAANLITNGSFESGFTGWTVNAAGGCNTAGCGTNTAPVVIPYGAAAGFPGGAFGEPIGPNGLVSPGGDAAGTKLAYFSSDTANPQSLTQSVNLVGGQTYQIGFDYYAPQNGINNPFDAQLELLINGVSQGLLFAGGNQNPATPAQTWLQFTSNFTANPGGLQPYTFEFRGLGVTAADFGIDRVFAVAVPEPSTWAMMILGIGFAGAVMRRRRQTISVKYA